MAVRPVYEVNVRSSPPWYHAYDVEFQWHGGFSKAQALRCIHSLHGAYAGLRKGRRILEVSSASENDLGRRLSAFSLTVRHDAVAESRPMPLEVAYQSSKIFRSHGRLSRAADLAPGKAKRLAVEVDSVDDLTGFEWNGCRWPLEPPTAFYDWLFVQAVRQDPELSRQIIGYDAFTDIKFNPSRSLSSQARSAALFVGLSIHDELQTAVASMESFLSFEAKQWRADE